MTDDSAPADLPTGWNAWHKKSRAPSVDEEPVGPGGPSSRCIAPGTSLVCAGDEVMATRSALVDGSNTWVRPVDATTDYSDYSGSSSSNGGTIIAPARTVCTPRLRRPVPRRRHDDPDRLRGQSARRRRSGVRGCRRPADDDISGRSVTRLGPATGRARRIVQVKGEQDIVGQGYGRVIRLGTGGTHRTMTLLNASSATLTAVRLSKAPPEVPPRSSCAAPTTSVRHPFGLDRGRTRPLTGRPRLHARRRPGGGHENGQGQVGD